MKQSETMEQNNSGYIGKAKAWAFSYGSAVGWGVFAMPGVIFLSSASPTETVIGMLIGAIVMIVIGACYGYLQERYSNCGGSFIFVLKTFGADHAYLCAWFMILAYTAVLWANVTGLAIVGRTIFDDTFMWGKLYEIAGYEIYVGEILLQVAVSCAAALLCIFAKRLVALLQLILAVVMIAGMAVCVFEIYINTGFDMSHLSLHNEGGSFLHVFRIVMLMPWAYVGFESFSHLSGELSFSLKKTRGLIISSAVMISLSYISMMLACGAVMSAGYDNLPDYIVDSASFDGVRFIMVIAFISAVLTGIIGMYTILSRIFGSMAENHVMPLWFGRKNKNDSYGNSVLAIMILTGIIPFLGRSAINWLLDVTTVGTIVAYGYTSIAALKDGLTEKAHGRRNLGIAGTVVTIMFVVVTIINNIMRETSLTAESYMLIVVWSLVGIIIFRIIFNKDSEHKFGHSSVVWIVLLFLICFTSFLWFRQTLEAEMDRLDEVSTDISDALLRSNFIQMALVLLGFVMVFNIFSAIRKREQILEAAKNKAEESSRAKTVFLSNMSHDIRTPMNAIIGYTNLALVKDTDKETMRGYMEKINASGQYLLHIINDILEMARIESGKLELNETGCDINIILDDIRDLFDIQMREKNLKYTVEAINITEPRIMCDKNLLDRVLLNFISNAYKFTPDGGEVSVIAEQTGKVSGGMVHHEIRVKDTGIGMTEEFAAKVYDAFERERTSTVSGIQGTGLGMAISKRIIDAMGGDIRVNTAPGKGTEFVINLDLKVDVTVGEYEGSTGSRADRTPDSRRKENDGRKENTVEEPEKGSGETDKAGDAVENKPGVPDFSGKRLLLVDDIEINREIALNLLKHLGFEVETAVNGKDALEKVAASEPGFFDAVLMDIQMPVMDGFEATKRIRSLDEALSGIPIIAMTANVLSEDREKAYATGMNGLIAKPIDISLMVETLSATFR